MPKIPLYNQGGPSPVELAAGRLGARPNEAALAAPARALTDLGETIGRTGRGFAQGEMRVQQSKLRFEEEKARVDFQFKKAEQERQDRDELKKLNLSLWSVLQLCATKMLAPTLLMQRQYLMPIFKSIRKNLRDVVTPIAFYPLP